MMPVTDMQHFTMSSCTDHIMCVFMLHIIYENVAELLHIHQKFKYVQSYWDAWWLTTYSSFLNICYLCSRRQIFVWATMKWRVVRLWSIRPLHPPPPMHYCRRRPTSSCHQQTGCERTLSWALPGPPYSGPAGKANPSLGITDTWYLVILYYIIISVLSMHLCHKIIVWYSVSYCVHYCTVRHFSCYWGEIWVMFGGRFKIWLGRGTGRVNSVNIDFITAAIICGYCTTQCKNIVSNY